MKTFVIWNPKNGLYWSNEMGWVDIYDADTFEEHERLSSRLPIDGVWVLEGCFDEPTQEDDWND
jgi:hypothetical protein